MADGLTGLPVRDRVDVLEAIAALRVSGEPVAAAGVRALADPRLRELVEATLVREGRILLGVQGNVYAIGYADEIAAALAVRGIGILEPVDRAVLCLALLHTVAIPRARSRGRAGDTWHEGERVPIAQVIGQYHGRGLTKETVEHAIARLKHLGLLRMGHDVSPGPVLLRLTPRRRAELWEDLVLICAPTSSRARHIREQRGTEAA
jgi:GNAT superfamily N-acetyltransferase